MLVTIPWSVNSCNKTTQTCAFDGWISRKSFWSLPTRWPSSINCFFHGAVFQTVYLWTNSMMHRTPEVYMWGECGHMGSALSCIESSYSRPPPTVPCPHFFFDMCCGKCWSAEVCLFFWFMYYVPLVIVCGEQNYRNIHIPFQEKFASPCWWNCWREFWWQLSA